MAFLCGFVLVVLFAAALATRPQAGALSGYSGTIGGSMSNTRYRPMLRLLDGPDFDLLSEAGDPKLMRQLRTARRTIFRGYLRGLRKDHALLCAQLRLAILEAGPEAKSLHFALLRMETTFNLLIILVNARLLVHAMGIGKIGVSALVESLESLRRQAELFAPAAA
jgi:hypothetical protein